MDLSVLVSPLYFVAMGAERRALRRRAVAEGRAPGELVAADYERRDTAASLGMGVLSLTTPLTASLVGTAALRRGRAGRIGRIVGYIALAAAVVTTVADVVERIAARAGESRRKVRAAARRVAAVGGVTTVAAGGVVLCATTASLGAASRHWRIGRRRDLGGGVVPHLLALVWWDLAYYWNHRMMHRVRALWAVHVPHHSSEHYNLGTALRQPVAGALGVGVPYGIIARAGVRPKVIDTAHALDLVYQFWIHTDTIRSLGPAEAVLNTPSHHRVHHGSNRRYLDRNHGGVLIVWDRLFGTFEPEHPDTDPVVYGLTENLETFDLVTIGVHEYRAMCRDIANSTNWRDRLGFVVRPPGWAYARRAELAAVTD
ncbi:MAG: sterol desaturase family protein [Ilumatobacteraceae bacterium]